MLHDLRHVTLLGSYYARFVQGCSKCNATYANVSFISAGRISRSQFNNVVNCSPLKNKRDEEKKYKEKDEK